MTTETLHPPALSADDIEHFVRKGYVVVRDCFTRAAADPIIAAAFDYEGERRDDPSTWKYDIHRGYGQGKAIPPFPVAQFAPRAYAATCQLMGGEGRFREPWSPYWENSDQLQNDFVYKWRCQFIINFNLGANIPWAPPPTKFVPPDQRRETDPPVIDYHKDGYWFKQFLDSPEQALLTVVLWDDVGHRGGATFIAPDSIQVMSRFLAERTDGAYRSEFAPLIDQCKEFKEMTGRCGDVILLHPFMLHNSSYNVSGHPRIMSNPPLALREPMDFNREDPAAFSPIERCILNALGVDRLDYKRTAGREYLEWDK